MLLQFVFSNSKLDEIGKILSPIPFQLSFESANTNALGICVDHTMTSSVEALANSHPELEVRAVLPRIGQGLYFLNDDRAVSIAPSAPRDLVLEHAYPDTKSIFCQYCLADLPGNNSCMIGQLTFRRRPVFHIFRSSSNTVYASEQFIDAVTKAGFDSGINVSPVQVEGATELSWFSLWAGNAPSPWPFWSLGSRMP